MHAFQYSYQRGDDVQMPVWFMEGLAEYLSAHEGLVPEALEAHALDGDAVHGLQRIASNPRVAEALLPPLEELAQLADYADALKHFEKRGRELGGVVIPTELSRTRLFCKFGLQAPTGAYDPSFLVLFGVCDDGHGSFASAAHGTSLQIIDLDGGFVQRAESPAVGLYEGQWYEVEVAFDGEQTIEASRNGKGAIRAPCGPRKEGGVFVWRSGDLSLGLQGYRRRAQTPVQSRA